MSHFNIFVMKNTMYQHVNMIISSRVQPTLKIACFYRQDIVIAAFLDKDKHDMFSC